MPRRERRHSAQLFVVIQSLRVFSRAILELLDRSFVVCDSGYVEIYLLTVCLHPSLLVRLLVRLHACMFACLHVCLLAYVFGLIAKAWACFLGLLDLFGVAWLGVACIGVL